ncbi:MAG: c-type cytochrome [Acidobacteria bacterium]|nr:c-type cytochrome [Acidobacteriota bacterium]MBI3427432.1 c-type cytochrome [Acidobacteriota bacterium]
MTGSVWKFVGLICAVAGALACQVSPREDVAAAVAQPIGAPVEINAPRGLPPLPAEQRPTADAVALGRRLFHDPQLSGDNTVSCASCHRPDLHFTDGLSVAAGVGKQRGPRNTPTVLNAAYQPAQFWDGRAASLEEQAGGPIANPKEMNMPHADCVTKLNASADYRAEFAKVFGPGAITMPKLKLALASYERTLLSGNSPFDRYQYGSDKTALNASAVRGLAVFSDKQRGNCAACHLIGEQSALFTDGKFHNLGTGMNAQGELSDQGRFAHTHVEAERGAFRTPSLRNVAKTAPYMHDGSLKTLKDVLDFYIGGGSSNPQLDPQIKPLTLTAQERSDLLAFLEALTGEAPTNAGPPGKE